MDADHSRSSDVVMVEVAASKVVEADTTTTLLPKNYAGNEKRKGISKVEKLGISGT